MKGKDGECHGIRLHGHPVETLPDAWGVLLEQTDPCMVIMASEAYCNMSPDGTLEEHGDFEKDFKENPMSSVSEILNVHGIDMETGRQYGGFVRFVIGDRGLPVFDRPNFDFVKDGALKCKIPVVFSHLRKVTMAMKMGEQNGQ